MKKLSNIELFNGITGKVFALLYQNFPRKTEINPASFLEDFIDEEDYDGAFDFDEIVAATLTWLDKAGYIWLNEPECYGASYSATLSHKGLETLKLIPDSIEQKITIGDKIIEFSKGKFSEGMNQIVTMAISEGIKLIFKP
ncbi:MAG: hypothetical protein D6707_12490 [Bacteroidetes bacterium]|nr:MAG: hypothetical protein D6707_12490 [Bacteroidota bacterium]